MIRKIQFPMLVESENAYRRLMPMVRAGKTKKQRKTVAEFLGAKGITKPIARLPNGDANRYVVRLTRIMHGAGLDHSNLTGAFKSVQDELADWLGLPSDRDPRVKWEYTQQQCHAPPRGPSCFVRITIRCLQEGGEVSIVLGAAPIALGVESEERPPPIEKKKPGAALGRAIQPVLPMRTCWVQYPWEQQPGEPPAVDELPEYNGVETPPAYIDAKMPAGWMPPTLRGVAVSPGITPTLRLSRTTFRDAELGEIWLYLYDPKPTARVAASG